MLAFVIFSHRLLAITSLLATIAPRVRGSLQHEVELARGFSPGGVELFPTSLIELPESYDQSDIIRVDRRDDEDFVYLFKRTTPNDCDDLTCTAWEYAYIEDATPEQLEEWDIKETLDQNETPDRRFVSHRSLAKRYSRKNINACQEEMKLWVDIQKTSKGKEKPQVFVQTENYPGPKDIVDGKDDEKERYKNIKAYNFKDYKDCDDFSFIQEKSLAILKSNYQTEHALEGQALSSFINDLSAGPKYDNLDPFNQMQDEKVTFCNLMLPYWRTEYDDKANELKVVDGKKYPDDNQDKEGKNSAATPAEWLASALPSRWSNWDEFMLLYTPVNGMKGRLWQDQPLVTEGANSEGKNMESLLDFKIAQVSNEDLKGLKSKDKKKLIKHDKIFGLEKAIEKWREVYGVYIYCSDKHFVKVFQDQVKRVAEMFDVLDKKELPKIKLRSTRRNPDKKQKDDVRDWPAWKPLELKQKWNDYIKERTGSRIKNLDDWLKKWHDAIQGVRGDLVKERDSAKGKKEKSEDSKERVDYLDKFIDRIDAVKKAFDNKGELKNPLA